jgi:hypothetical protein
MTEEKSSRVLPKADKDASILTTHRSAAQLPTWMEFEVNMDVLRHAGLLSASDDSTWTRFETKSVEPSQLKPTARAKAPVHAGPFRDKGAPTFAYAIAKGVTLGRDIP